jgi:hypothetical protein
MAMPANNPLGPVVDAADPPVPPAADNAMLVSAVMPDVPIGLRCTFGGAGPDVALVQAEMWLDGQTGLALWGDQGTCVASEATRRREPELSAVSSSRASSGLFDLIYFSLGHCWQVRCASWLL